MGEQVAGESAKIRAELEGLISSVNKSTFDIAELLAKVKKNAYYVSWGYNTFTEYVDGLELKARKAQYLVRIVDVMNEVNVPREQYEQLGVAKLREITSLEPSGTFKNPQTGVETPNKEFIVGFVEKGQDMSLEEIKQYVRTLKGLVGENEIVWINFPIKQIVKEQIITPALELAKANIGSVAKDADGNSLDASDSSALEFIAAEFLNDPANNYKTDELEK